MIISMKKGAPQEEINKLVRSFEEMGLSVTTIYGEDYNVFGLVGDTTRVDETQIAVNPYVDTVTRVSAPYKKVNRLFHPEDSVIDCGGVRIGGRRLSGLRRILEERGLYDPTVFHVGDISRESGYTLARQAAREGRLAEAMLLGSDEVAEGALEAFRELGLRVPKDVAVIIYQDIQTLESKWPTGTCIEMFPDYIWENALEILFGRISQKRTQAVTVVVPTHIRIGDTA